MKEKKFELPTLTICTVNIEEASITSYICCTDGVDKNGSSCCEIA